MQSIDLRNRNLDASILGQLENVSAENPLSEICHDVWLRCRWIVILLWPPYVIGQAIIFLSCGFFFFLYSYSSSSSFSSPNLSRQKLDVYHNFTHDVALVQS